MAVPASGVNKSHALAVAFVVMGSGTGTALDVFDSPGRGYREQRDGNSHLLFPDNATNGRAAAATLMKIRLQWPNHSADSEKLEAVAEFARTEAGAKEKISRAVVEAGIPFLLTDKTQTVVQVPPTRAVQARAVLRKLRDEASAAAGTLRIPAEALLPPSGR